MEIEIADETISILCIRSRLWHSQKHSSPLYSISAFDVGRKLGCDGGVDLRERRCPNLAQREDKEGKHHSRQTT
jgi:hypothetical protein